MLEAAWSARDCEAEHQLEAALEPQVDVYCSLCDSSRVQMGLKEMYLIAEGSWSGGEAADFCSLKPFPCYLDIQKLDSEPYIPTKSPENEAEHQSAAKLKIQETHGLKCSWMLQLKHLPATLYVRHARFDESAPDPAYSWVLQLYVSYLLTMAASVIIT